MKFDFEVFANMAINTYNSMDEHSFTLEEVLEIFRYYFDSYEKYMGTTHPPIKYNQIKRIIEKMPLCYDMNDDYIELDYECYPIMIERYFETEFLNCDYNINHFFSGKIRANKFYEVCY